MKLLQKDLKLYRELKYKEQSGICPLCERFIAPDEAALDHCHKTGHCRAVLHNNCNVVEGKLLNAFTRWVSKKGIPYVSFIYNLLNYMVRDYSENPIHPTELTEDEKELKMITKKLKGLKRESVIEEYKSRAKKLRKKIKEDRKFNTWKP